jgi:S1-C subfamily serine protease
MRLLVALALFLITGCASQHFKEPRSFTREIRMEGVEYSICSGVMVAPHIMVTAAHCAGDKLLVGGKPAKVLKKNDAEDVAVLEVAEVCPCAQIAHAPVQIDEQVVVVGFPMNDFVHGQILTEGRAQGEVESPRGIRQRITAPIAPGNSGGGVFVNRLGRWELVGLASAVVQRCDDIGMCSLITHLAFATTLDSLKHILKA